MTREEREKISATMSERTYVVEHNPNCPSKYLVRLPGRSGIIDNLPTKVSGDVFAYGDTFEEAAEKALKEYESARRMRLGASHARRRNLVRENIERSMHPPG